MEKYLHSSKTKECLHFCMYLEESKLKYQSQTDNYVYQKRVETSVSKRNTGITKTERNLCSQNDSMDEAFLKDTRKE